MKLCAPPFTSLSGLLTLADLIWLCTFTPPVSHHRASCMPAATLQSLLLLVGMCQSLQIIN